MSLRTHGGLLWKASILFVVAACGGTTATSSPTGGAATATPAATTPAAATSAPAESPGTSPAESPGTSPAESPGTSPAESPSPSGTAIDPDAPPDLFTTTYEPTTEGAVEGGTVIVADWQEANLFNPYYYNQVTEADVNRSTFGTLVTSTHDFKYAPDQATTIPTTENGGVKQPGDGGDAMTVTWKLRDGLKWSDGEDLNCDYFDFTLKWIMDPANTGLPGGKTSYQDISSIECTSPTVMVLHF